MCNIPLLVFPELRKHWVYVLKGCIGLISHLKIRNETMLIRSNQNSIKTWEGRTKKKESSDITLALVRTIFPDTKKGKHNLWLFHAIDQPWEQLWLILTTRMGTQSISILKVLKLLQNKVETLLDQKDT